MVTTLAILHVITCVFLILLIMIQDPKGGSSGIFSGGSNSIISSSGSADFLTRITRYTAIVFGALCIVLTIVTKPSTTGVFSKVPVPAGAAAPAQPATDGTAVNPSPTAPPPGAPVTPESKADKK